MRRSFGSGNDEPMRRADGLDAVAVEVESATGSRRRPWRGRSSHRAAPGRAGRSFHPAGKSPSRGSSSRTRCASCRVFARPRRGCRRRRCWLAGSARTGLRPRCRRDARCSAAGDERIHGPRIGQIADDHFLVGLGLGHRGDVGDAQHRRVLAQALAQHSAETTGGAGEQEPCGFQAHAAAACCAEAHCTEVTLAGRSRPWNFL